LRVDLSISEMFDPVLAFPEKRGERF